MIFYNKIINDVIDNKSVNIIEKSIIDIEKFKNQIDSLKNTENNEEYKDKNFTAKDICMKRNIRFVYNKRDHEFSTSSLRKRIYEQESTKRFVK